MPGLLPDQQPQSQGLLHGFFNNGGLAGLLGMQPLAQRMVDESQAWNAQAKAAGMAPPPPQAWSPEATELADIAGNFDMTGAIKAYHGSPHTFDRFDMSKIGTGEGAQAYGHGLYFAENPGVAKDYYERLNPPAKPSSRIPELETLMPDQSMRALVSSALIRNAGDATKASADLRERGSGLSVMAADALDKVAPGAKFDVMDEPPKPGSTYTVNLDVNHDDLLDWDAPLSQQPEKVRKALEQFSPIFEKAGYQGGLAGMANKDGRTAYERLALAAGGTGGMKPEGAAEMLRAAGIPGIRYLDAGSRAGGEGSRNFVLFDDAFAQILERNGQPVGPRLPEGVSIQKEKNGAYTIQADGKNIGRAALAGDGAKPFVDIINVDPAYQRKGIASAVYDFIEQDIGRKLVPSPLGLSEAATGVWQKRLANVPAAERDALLAEAKQIGLSYMPSGMPDSELKIRDQWIESRLAPFRGKP